MKGDSVKKNKCFYVLSLCLLILILSAGCSQKAQKAPSEKELAAKIGDKFLTKKQLEESINQKAADNPRYGELTKNKQFKDKEIKQLIDQWINNQLLELLTEKEQVKIDSNLIDEQVAKFKENLILQHKKKALQEKIANEIKISDSEIDKYYVDNEKRFMNPVMLRVSYILVKSKKEAQNVMKELKAKKKFSDLAAKYSSDDASKKAGGDLGWIKLSDLRKPPYKKIIPFSKGKTMLFNTKKGFEIFRLEDREQEAKLLDDKLRGEIKSTLLDKKIKEALDKMTEKLTKETKVERYKI